MKNLNQEKTNPFKRFLMDAIQLYLTLEYEVYHLSPLTKRILIIINGLQTISFVIEPLIDINYEGITPLSISIQNWFWFICFFTRPQNMIIQLNRSNWQQNFLSLSYAFLVLKLMMILILVGFLVYLKNQDTTKSFSNVVEKFPRPVLLIIKTISLYSQCFKVIIFIPLIEVLLLVMKNEHNGGGFTSAGFWLPLISIGLIFLHCTVKFLITEETITLKITGFEKLNRSVGSVFIDVFTVFQIIVSSFINSLDYALYFQLILTILIGYLRLREIFLLYQISDISIANLIIFTQTFNFSMVLVCLATRITNIVDSRHEAVIITLIFGLFTRQGLNHYKEQELKMFLRPESVRSPDALKYLLYKSLNDDNSTSQSQGQVQMHKVFVCKHSSKCEDIICTCQQITVVSNMLHGNSRKEIQSGIILKKLGSLRTTQIKCCNLKDMETPQQIIQLSDLLQFTYQDIVLKHYCNIISTITNLSDKFSYSLHLISFLNLMGHYASSFRKVNYLLYRQQKQIDKIHREQVMMTAQATELQTINSERRRFASNINSTNFQTTNLQQIEGGNSKRRKTNVPSISDFNTMNNTQTTIQNQLKIDELQMPSVGKLNLIYDQKLKYLQINIKTLMLSSLLSRIDSSKSQQTEEINFAVMNFSQLEQFYENIRNHLLSVLQSKLSYLNLITSTSDISSLEFFDKIMRLGAKLLRLENNLTKLYQEHPSQKLQSLLIFFQAEIMNNFLQAYKIDSQTTLSDDKLLKYQKNVHINLYSTKLTYMIIDLGHSSQTLSILKTAFTSHELFDYTFDDFKSHQTLDFLLPPAIRTCHHQMVDRFLLSGTSKFFRNPEISFAINKKNFLLVVNFFFDIDVSNMQGLSFVAFIEKLTDTSAYIMVDEDGLIGGITQNFFEKIGYRYSLINSMDVGEHFMNLQIESVIPDFDLMVNLDEQYDHKAQLKILHFIKPEIIKKNIKQTVYFQRATNNRSKQTKVWDKQNQLNTFKGKFQILRRNVGDKMFFIVQFDDIYRVKSQNRTFTHQTQNSDQTRFVKQQTATTVPKGTDSRRQTVLNFGIQEEDKSGLSGSDCERQSKKQSPQISTPSEEAAIAKPQVLVFGEEEFPNLEDLESDSPMRNIVPEELKINNLESIQIQDDQNKHIKIQVQIQNPFSPRSSQGPILKNDNYNTDTANLFRQDSSSNVQSGFVNSIEVDINKIEIEDVSNNLKKQHRDSKTSSVNSQTGIRRSQYFKKYELINQISQSKKTYSEIVSMNIFFSASTLIGVVFSIIMLNFIQSDLNQFISRLDTLQIMNHFLAPVVQFTVERQGVSRYDEQLSLNLISKSLHDNLTIYLIDQMKVDYFILRNGFTVQLSNQYLEVFFQNRFIQLNQGLNNSQREYTLSLKESLIIMLNDIYQYHLVFEGIIDKALFRKIPQFFYLYANLYHFVELFSNLNKDTLNHALTSTQQIQDKWSQVYAVLLSLLITLGFIAWYFYRLYIGKIDGIIYIFKSLTMESIDMDKLRYRQLILQLTKEFNRIYSYKFDLDSKEQILRQQRPSGVEKSRQRNQSQLNKAVKHFRLPYWRSLILYMLYISGYAALFSTIDFTTQNYLSSSKETNKFLKQISDISFYVPYIFMTRELLFNISFFPLTLEDGQNYLKMQRVAYSKIDQFTSMLGNTNMDQFLISPSFKLELTQIESQNLCDFLDQGLQEGARYYCENAFGGVMQQGLIQTLVTMKSALQTEQQVNNFTSRLTFPNLQIEAEFLTQRVIKGLIQKFQENVIHITNDHIQLILELCSLIILYSFLLNFIQYQIIQKYIQDQLRISKRIIQLMPQQSLLDDDQFERNLKFIVVSLKFL